MSKNFAEHLDWEIGVDFPEWGNTEEYVKTISRGYLINNEKPRDAYWRVANAAANRLNRTDLAPKFFEYIWNNWLGWYNWLCCIF